MTNKIERVSIEKIDENYSVKAFYADGGTQEELLTTSNLTNEDRELIRKIVEKVFRVGE